MTHAPAIPRVPIDRTAIAVRQKNGQRRGECLRPPAMDNLPPLKAGGAWPRILCRGHETTYYFQNNQTKTVAASVRMALNGAPRAFHLVDAGSLVPLAEERLNGFPSMVVKDGRLITQGPRDPAPGFLVSRTAYQVLDYPEENPKRYVDASAKQYLAVPLRLMLCAMELGFPPILGCKALVWDLERKYWCTVPVCDIAPDGYALSQRVFRDWSIGPKFDQVATKVEIQLFPGVPQEGYELQEWRPE